MVQQLPLTRIIVALCVGLILVAAAVSLIVTYTFSVDAATSLATRHASALSRKAVDDVQNMLGNPLGFVGGLQYTLRQDSYSLPSDAERAGDALWYRWWWQQMVSAMKAVEFAYQYAVVGFDDGNYAGCKLCEKGFMCRVFLWNKSRSEKDNDGGTSSVIDEVYKLSDGSLIARSETTIKYDPRTRVWYSMVVHEPMAMEWSSVYLSAMPTLPIVDVNGALFNVSGTFLGVVSLTFELYALSDFLKNLGTTENTQSFLLDNDGLIMASSHPAPFLTEVNITTSAAVTIPPNCVASDTGNNATRSIVLCRLSAEAFPYPPLQHLAAHGLTNASNTSGASHREEVDGNKYWVVIKEIETPSAGGMHWKFILLMPEMDIIGGIVRGRDVAMIIVGCVLLVTFIASGVICLCANVLCPSAFPAKAAPLPTEEPLPLPELRPNSRSPADSEMSGIVRVPPYRLRSEDSLTHQDTEDRYNEATPDVAAHQYSSMYEADGQRHHGELPSLRDSPTPPQPGVVHDE